MKTKMKTFALTAALICGFGSIAMADQGEARLLAEMDKLQTTPCATQLTLERLVGTWYVTCPNCAAVPARNLYPKAVINMAENYAVNKKISLTQLLRLTGECR